jgi:pyrroloquinoline quinone biosynthesis protein D
MSEAVDERRVPSFRRGSKFRFDAVRDAWVVLAPERLFMPDEHAVEILKLVDGVRTLGDITDDLCTRYDAPRDLVLTDVAAMLDDLAEKGVIAW